MNKEFNRELYLDVAEKVSNNDYAPFYQAFTCSLLIRARGYLERMVYEKLFKEVNSNNWLQFQLNDFSETDLANMRLLLLCFAYEFTKGWTLEDAIKFIETSGRDAIRDEQGNECLPSSSC